MTIKQLKEYLTELETLHNENTHVFMAEAFISGNTVHTQVRDFEKTDLSYIKNVEDAASWKVSQFNEGLVFGFVPTVE